MRPRGAKNRGAIIRRLPPRQLPGPCAHTYLAMLFAEGAEGAFAVGHFSIGFCRWGRGGLGLCGKGAHGLRLPRGIYPSDILLSCAVAIQFYLNVCVFARWTLCKRELERAESVGRLRVRERHGGGGRCARQRRHHRPPCLEHAVAGSVNHKRVGDGADFAHFGFFFCKLIKRFIF